MKAALLPILERQHLEGRVVALMEFGSRVYGTSTPSSDWDYKGIMLPTANELLDGETSSGFTERSNPSDSDVRNGPEDVDVEFYSVYRFMELLMEGQTVAIDMLFCPDIQKMAITPIFDRIWAMRDKVLNRHCGAAIGYAKAQAHKYSLRGDRIQALSTICGNLAGMYHTKPRATLEEWVETMGGKEKVMMMFSDKEKPYVAWLKQNKAPFTELMEVCGKRAGFQSSVKFAYELFVAQLGEYGDRARAARDAGGADWKAMYHALRIAAQTVELLKTGHVTFPRPEATFLLKVRRGEIPVEDVSALIENGIEEIRVAQEASILREDPDRTAVKLFIRQIHLDIIKGEYL